MLLFCIFPNWFGRWCLQKALPVQESSLIFLVFYMYFIIHLSLLFFVGLLNINFLSDNLFLSFPFYQPQDFISSGGIFVDKSIPN